MRSHCAGCEAKAQEIADLKREVGALKSWRRAQYLADTLQVRGTVARMLLRLYDAKGRPVTARVLDQDAGTPGYARIWISIMRQSIGKEAVCYTGGGYALSPVGLEMLTEILG